MNFLFFVAAILSVIPVIFTKLYSKDPNFLYLMMSFISSFMLSITYVYIFKDKDVTLSYSFIKVLSILMILGYDIFIFKTKFELKSIIGIIFAIISILLLSK
jgi:multidrug transporter EmrE-like cation transporter